MVDGRRNAEPLPQLMFEAASELAMLYRSNSTEMEVPLPALKRFSVRRSRMTMLSCVRESIGSVRMR